MKKSGSQWDFGELFPTAQSRKVLSVSELTAQIRRLLEKHVGQVWVTGEVTNLRVQSSGHIYFTLKDAGSQVSCVLFRGESVAHRELLQDGQRLLLQADMTVYEPRGQYQLVVRSMELQGVGTLQLAFEKLKQKLQAEGLFAPERKRPLPKYPRCIGLVTSPTGAAIRDVLHVIQRRNPALEIIVAPCRVQGEGAAQEIAEAIRLLNQFHRGIQHPASGIQHPASGIRHPASSIDLILLTRGGGSLEDLWAFNEEIVARAIFESALPVVSAVGHEIDFTISDFVADLRAATPSAAAEIITEHVYASREFVAEAPESMRQLLRRRLENDQEDLGALIDRIARVHPRRRIQDQLQFLDELQTGLLRAARRRWHDCHNASLGASQRLLRVRPAQFLTRRIQFVGELKRRLCEQLRHGVTNLRARYGTVEARLRLLSPENVLERGYSITMDAVTGKVIRDAGEVEAGRRLKTRVKRGEIRSVVQPGD